MTILANKPVQLTPGSLSSPITLTVADLASLVDSLTSDTYWRDEGTTWDNVDFIYKNSGGQLVRLSFDLSANSVNPTSVFNIHAQARIQDMQCERIIINGSVADTFTIKRSEFTNPSEFDIQIVSPVFFTRNFSNPPLNEEFTLDNASYVGDTLLLSLPNLSQQTAAWQLDLGFNSYSLLPNTAYSIEIDYNAIGMSVATELNVVLKGSIPSVKYGGDFSVAPGTVVYIVTTGETTAPTTPFGTDDILTIELSDGTNYSAYLSITEIRVNPV